MIKLNWWKAYCSILFFIFSGIKVNGQDTLKLNKFFDKKIWESNDGFGFSLKNKSFLVPTGVSLENLMLTDKQFRKIVNGKDPQKRQVFLGLEGNHLTSSVKEEGTIFLNRPIFSKATLSLKKNIIGPSTFFLSGDFMYINCDSNEVDLRILRAKSRPGFNIDFSYNTGEFSVESSNLSLLSLFHQRSKSDSLRISFNADTIDGVWITDSEIKKLKIDITNSYFPHHISVENRNGARKLSKYDVEEFFPESNLTMTYNDCTFNGYINSSGCLYRSKLIFDNAHFGESAQIKNIGYDTIMFTNCTDFAKPLPLSLDAGSKYLYLSFVNSDVSKLDFNFSERMKMFFEPSVEQDQITNTFENLLAKFTKEGKLESLKNVDIQYTIYKNQRFGILGSVINAINKYWWFYGYKRWLIVFWTLGFLLLFFFINVMLWKEMRNVYPVVILNHRTYLRNHSRRQLRANQMISIFVFTAFVFFSLRVDFSKISFERSRLLLLFFLEYAVGLICAFFIVNAILKIH